MGILPLIKQKFGKKHKEPNYRTKIISLTEVKMNKKNSREMKKKKPTN